MKNLENFMYSKHRVQFNWFLQKKSVNEKKLKESQTRLMSYCWKRKPSCRKDLITYNSHPWIMFSLIYRLSFGEGTGWGVSFKIGHPRSREWKNFGRRWTRGVGGSWNLENFRGRHMCVNRLCNLVERGSSKNT